MPSSIILPRRPPDFIDKAAPSFGVDSFQADAGVPTRISTAAQPHSATLKLKYTGVHPSEVGTFMAFMRTIRYDESKKASLFSFAIPKNHLLWRGLPEWEYLESEWLSTGDADTALWQMTDFSGVTAEVVGINGFEFHVVNVWD